MVGLEKEDAQNEVLVGRYGKVVSLGGDIVALFRL